jgi:hypothetical protein
MGYSLLKIDCKEFNLCIITNAIAAGRDKIPDVS